MRLLNRTQREIVVAPRAVDADGLDGIVERFSADRSVLLGNIGFVNNTLNSNANAMMSTSMGVRELQTLRLRFMGDAAIFPGDGVMLPGETEVCWRCVEVSRYPLITVARVERVAGV